jgi:uncharacterized protein (TIGR03083 family)
MDFADHVQALAVEGRWLVDAAERAGLAASVPTCPGWRVAELLRHVGGVHRWAAGYVGTGLDRPTTEEEDAAYFAAPPEDQLLAWCRQAHAALLAALAAPGAENTRWSFLPAASHLAFWARRQAHETAIHRADAAAAGGVAGGMPAYPSDFAADGIAELLVGFFARRRGQPIADPQVTLGVRALDADAAWTVTIGPTGRTISAGLGAADCVLAGPASELYLLLWNRTDLDQVTVTGDRRILDLWRSDATVRWA